MTTFCQTLLTMTAAATAAALAVMVLRILLKKAPRWLTCALWLVVFLRMVCPVSFQAPVSLVPDTLTQTAQQAVSLPVRQTADPVQAETEPQSAPVLTEPVQEEALSVPQAETITLSQVLFPVWAVGAATALLWAAGSYLRLRRRISDAVRIQGNVYESDRIDTPFVCGFFRPRIYLPVGLSPADRPYVLLHEQAHIRRLDHLTKPLAYLALCVHWFNPVLWLAFRLFCRDVESACDQAVIRDFDREKTAGYAAALLHLGRRRTLPQAVPLAFGEEDAKGRIRHVLDYKHPRVLVLLAAVVVCVIAAVVILANPTQQGEQLEGVAVTRCYAVENGLPVDLPEDLRTRLTALLADHGHESYAALDSYSPTEGTLVLNNSVQGATQASGTAFYFDPAEMTLTRVNHDGYSATRKQAALKDTLAQDPEYLTWMADLKTYLTTGRADALYALKTPYIGSVPACGAILQELNVGEVLGPYTVELQTDREPYGITLHTDRSFGAFQEEREAYLDYVSQVGWLFLALVDNAGRFTVTYDDGSHTVSAYGELKNLSPDAFRLFYTSHIPVSPAGDFPQSFVPVKTLYVSPGGTELAEAAEEDGRCFFEGGAVTISQDRFSAHLTNPLSSTYSEEAVYDSPVYDQQSGLPSLVTREGETLTLPLSTSLDYIRVLARTGDGETESTGYSLYQTDQGYFLSHHVQTDGGARLEYLVQIEPAA